MAKKRKASSRPAATDGADGFDERGGKMGPISTYEDVANSEDEFHIQRNKVLLDEGPDSRRRKWQEEGMFPSLLGAKTRGQLLTMLQMHSSSPPTKKFSGYSSESEEEEYDDEIKEDAPAKTVEMDSEAEQEEEEEEEEGGWGTSKKDYYNNDTIETEINAREEEEAKRLQQKKLQKMSEADFGFDESEWLDTGDNEDEDGDVVTEVLKDMEITPDMSPEERLRILQNRYPEFEFLANEFFASYSLYCRIYSSKRKQKRGKYYDDGQVPGTRRRLSSLSPCISRS